MSKVVYGLLQSHSRWYDTRESVLRLWVHECMRVFGDRLMSAEMCAGSVLAFGKFVFADFHAKESPVRTRLVELTEVMDGGAIGQFGCPADLFH